MKVVAVDNKIEIELSTYHKDEYYIMQTTLSENERQTGQTLIQLPLDRAIELRDKLTRAINTEVAKINVELNPEQTAKELADVIDWTFKEA